jgi:hypothetical protein
VALTVCNVKRKDSGPKGRFKETASFNGRKAAAPSINQIVQGDFGSSFPAHAAVELRHE